MIWFFFLIYYDNTVGWESVLGRNIVHNGQMQSATICKTRSSSSVAGYFYCIWNREISLKFLVCVCVFVCVCVYMHIMVYVDMNIVYI